jgi:hypothetical protein
MGRNDGRGANAGFRRRHLTSPPRANANKVHARTISGALPGCLPTGAVATTAMLQWCPGRTEPHTARMT